MTPRLLDAMSEEVDDVGECVFGRNWFGDRPERSTFA
jgi:hypothetical protein